MFRTTSFSASGQEQGIHQYIPPDLKRMFYKNPARVHASHNGLDPYGFSTRGLVLYLPLWALKDNSFKSVDLYKHTAAVTGASCIWIPEGREFDGTDDTIIVPNHTSLNFGANQDFTLMGWGNPTTGPLYMVFKGEMGAGKAHYNLAVDGNGFVRGWIDDGTNSVTVTGTTNSFTAQHLYAMTCDRDGNLTVYLDGVSEGTPASIAGVGDVDNTEDLYISGRFLDGVQDFEWNGTISEDWTYNRLLPAGEILHTYNRTKWRYQ